MKIEVCISCIDDGRVPRHKIITWDIKGNQSRDVRMNRVYEAIVAALKAMPRHVDRPGAQKVRPLNQCEYPDLRGELGDTCTKLTDQERTTIRGTFWLCPDHIGCPIDQLFDPRME
jgi:hypothetical protein